MFEWVFLLFSQRMNADAPTPTEYYVGLVAAEAAYTTLQTTVPDQPQPPAPTPVDPKNCPTCKNSGRPGWVRTGDDQNWTRCPTCQPVESAAPAPQQPSAVWPPKPRNDCPTGTCPTPTTPEPKAAGVAIPVPAPLPRRFPRRR